jgi:hypothetical protein
MEPGPIEELTDCTAAEADRHVGYLLGAPRHDLATEVLRGHRIVRRGLICSVSALGDLPTGWSVLEGTKLRLRPPDGRRRFRVREVLPLLIEHGVEEFPDLRTIGEHMRLHAELALDVLITLVREDSGMAYIVDGNKRAVAVYERRRRSGGDLDLPVYLLDRP